MPGSKIVALSLLLVSAPLVSANAETSLPDAIAAPGETAVLTMHAEGAQVYECKAGTDGKRSKIDADEADPIDECRHFRFCCLVVAGIKQHALAAIGARIVGQNL